MSLIIVLIFFKSICLYLQNIVLCCYEKFLNPKQKYWLSSTSSTSIFSPGSSSTTTAAGSANQCRGYRSILSSSSSALSKTRALERERLLEQIRARKKNKIRANNANKAYWKGLNDSKNKNRVSVCNIKLDTNWIEVGFDYAYFFVSVYDGYNLNAHEHFICPENQWNIFTNWKAIINIKQCLLQSTV